MPEPQDVADVRRFMGMVNFVGKFSPRLPDLTKPIRDLLKTEQLDMGSTSTESVPGNKERTGVRDSVSPVQSRT